MKQRGYIGRIRALTGKDGSLILGDCSPRFSGLPAGVTVYLGYSEQFVQPYTVQRCDNSGKNQFTIMLKGIQDTDTARNLLETGVFADEELQRRQTDSEYLESDIVGCTVQNIHTGETLGVVTEIWYMPANDVWVVDYHGKELPVPFIEPIVKKVDRNNKIIAIEVMEGLLELATSQSLPDKDE